MLQCKMLLTTVCSVDCDGCNPGTYHETHCFIRGDAVSASTGWKWSKRIIFFPASISSTVCSWMVFEKKVSEENRELSMVVVKFRS